MSSMLPTFPENRLKSYIGYTVTVKYAHDRPLDKQSGLELWITKIMTEGNRDPRRILRYTGVLTGVSAGLAFFDDVQEKGETDSGANILTREIIDITIVRVRDEAQA